MSFFQASSGAVCVALSFGFLSVFSVRHGKGPFFHQLFCAIGARARRVRRGATSVRSPSVLEVWESRVLRQLASILRRLQRPPPNCNGKDRIRPPTVTKLADSPAKVTEELVQTVDVCDEDETSRGTLQIKLYTFYIVTATR